MAGTPRDRGHQSTPGSGDRDAVLSRLDTISRILDAAIPIPGTRQRVGLDALLGLIPGVGDSLGVLLSTYIIVAAARLGYPPTTLLRMVANVVIEGAIGAFPILGDIFDVIWKANVRNVALLQAERPRHGRSSRAILILIGVIVAVVAIGFAALGIVIFAAVLRATS